MLPADVLDVFEKRLAGLPRPVTIEYFQTGGNRLTVPGRAALPPCLDCRSTLELLQEVTAVSDLVSLAVHEFGHDPQLAAEYDVDRVPGIVVNGGSGRRLHLYGLPLGHLLPVLLDALLRVAREPGEPPEEVTRILDEIDAPLQVRVVGSVRHSPATQAAIVAYTLASYFDRVDASVYAMESFPELVRDLDMTHTPLTFVNQSLGFAGVTTLVALAQYALDSQNEPDDPRPPTVASGTIGEVAGRTAQAPARPGSSGLALPPSAGGVWRPAGSPPTPAPTRGRSTAAARAGASLEDRGSPPGSDRTEIAIIGGGPAGLQAALVLSRARRAVVVFDEPSPPRNAASHGVHGFLGIEGMSPQEVRRVTWEQIGRYGGATLREERVVDVQRDAGPDFVLTTEQGSRLRARQVMLAFGYRDVFPDVPGFAECWGETIIPCVLCDGYEHRDRAWGIVRASADAPTTDPLIALHWTKQIQLILGGDVELPQRYRSRLSQLGVGVHRGEVVAIAHDDRQIRSVRLDTGRDLGIETLLWMPPTEPSPLVPRLVETLGLALNRGGNVAADNRQQTNVAGLWAAGDVQGWAGAIGAARQGGTAAEFIIHGWYE